MYMQENTHTESSIIWTLFSNILWPPRKYSMAPRLGTTALDFSDEDILYSHTFYAKCALRLKKNITLDNNKVVVKLQILIP